MIDLRQTLPVLFSYDHTSGIFHAQLPNGSRIPVSRHDVGGRLENALTLFKRQVIDLNSGKYVQARNAKGELTYSYSEEQVTRYGHAKIHASGPLSELELDLSDLL